MQSYLNLADNPLFIKHVRSRMRRSQLMPSIVMVCFVSLCIVLLEMKVWRPGMMTGSLVFFVMQGIILMLMGGSQVAAAVASIKESGMLDFHRITPVPARVQVVGFLLGAPIREWTLFACTLPFALFVAMSGPWGVVGFTKVLLVQMTGAFLYHSFGLVSGLVGKSTRSASGRVVAMIVLLNIVAANLASAPNQPVHGPALLTPVPVLREVIAEAEAKPQPGVPAPPRFGGPQLQVGEAHFFAVAAPLVLQTLVFQGAIFIFLMIAATRRFRSNRLPLYTKPEAVAFMATLAILTLGSLWETRMETITLATAYFLLFAGVWLASTVTPSLGDFMKGLQRARRRGSLLVPHWNDLASNKVAVLVMGLLIVGILTLANVASPGPPRGPMAAPGPPVFAGARIFEPWGPMAVAALSLLSFGWALQYFHLHYDRRAQSFFTLYLFAVWIVPVVIGALALSAGAREAGPIMGVSPFVGIAFAGLRNLPQMDATIMQIVSIGPPAILTILFGILLTSEEKRRIEQVQKEHEVKHPEEGAAVRASARFADE